ncbi:protein kinase, putative [Entamoeba histolytica HM-1:IMSS-B]|uniref:Protein kinase, putative n=5 Tax=Entamoeba histolytica TaxID=5759 RepID=C4M6T0_ENTH1|nr:protein kinase, putative [Entamoeba histolytica HM-1:IMSS]EMH74790.1 protein kinase, putative [Entamoeba histolytica HM-1:IMSS-B]EMS12936.1 serine-threonine protein kinase, putative [Entamoeba histolytica HM-3:IMSS]ENY66005.1 protein kinase, putative [Entamoeba histolytica HM-1:IMSS-A]GAT97204.1 protein kinase putative [Entamoeba histolytica]EAL44293.1 protein kinase, putative [Entamoeba histolytica HM-1:IMSS]|eukprot:XP_649681.1 protein kinase, putative [Entamoeba histolytica HM-1:IMSS]
MFVTTTQHIIIIILLFIYISNGSLCGVGCFNCLYDGYCESCMKGYNPNDKNCSECFHFNPRQNISEENPVTIQRNGICVIVNQTLHPLTLSWHPGTKYNTIASFTDSTIQTDVNISYEEIETAVAIGPCASSRITNKLFKLTRIMEIDTTGKSSTLINFEIKFKTNIQSQVIMSVTTNSPSDSTAICLGQTILKPGTTRAYMALTFYDNTKYYLFLQSEEDVEVIFTTEIDPSKVFFNLIGRFNQTFFNNLIHKDESYQINVPISSQGIVFSPECANNLYLRGMAFTVSVPEAYSLLIDTTASNKLAYLIEIIKVTENGLTDGCLDVWVGRKWNDWLADGEELGLSVRTTGNHSFFLMLDEFLEDIELTFKMICHNDCHYNEGHGFCNLITKGCECKEGYGYDDCSELCYYNGKWRSDINPSDSSTCYYGETGCKSRDCTCDEGYSTKEHRCVSNTCLNKIIGGKDECLEGTGCNTEICRCNKNYIVTEEQKCKLITCGNGRIEEGEECDNTTSCNNYCQCEKGYISQNGICQKKENIWWVSIIIVGGCGIIILIMLISIFYFVFRTKKRVSISVYRTQQATYYHDISRAIKENKGIELPYKIERNDLSFGNEGKTTNINETRFQDVEIENKSSKWMTIIFHTPKTPKYVFYFEPQILTIKGKHKKTETIMMTLFCTTKIMGMKIPYTIYFSKKKETLKEITHLLKDKDFETWNEKDKENMDILMKSVNKKYYGNFIIATEATNSTNLDLDELQIREPPIGNGAMGTVYLGKYRSIPVAVKQFHWENLNDKEMEELKEEVIGECELVSKLRNPFIVNYIGSVTYIPEICMVTIYMPLGSLSNYIRKDNSENIILPFDLKMRILYDTSKGMVFLHENNIMHLDLKPDNILLNSLYSDSGCVAKITDFGTSRFTKRKNNDKGLGTPIYIAPECYQDKYYNASDVFSFAITAWELFYAKEPYSECKSVFDIKNIVINGGRLEIDEKMPDKLRSLIVNCWKQEPNERPNFLAISKSMTEICKDAINHKEFDKDVSNKRIEQIIAKKKELIESMTEDDAE